MERIHLRRATHRDTAVIAAHNHSMAMESEQKTLDPAIAFPGVERLIQDPSRGFYLLAEEGGRIVGQCMITYEWSDWRNGTFWWIQSVYVVPEKRRKGIFTTLLRHLEEEAYRQQDVVGIRLYVDCTNTAATDTYRSLGMTETRYRIFEREFPRFPGGAARPGP